MDKRLWGLLAAVGLVGALAAPPALRAQTCDDGNQCTTSDMCSNGSCTGTPVNSGTCDDGNPCTINDTCVNGTCQGTPMVGLTCGDTGCEGTCDGLGFCEPDPAKQGQPCTDSFGACTTNDVCTATLCFGTFKQCPDSDNNKCTLDACNPATGVCENFGPLPCGACAACDQATGACTPANEGMACEDEDVCTGNGTCADGACVAGMEVGTATATLTPTATPVRSVGTPTDTPTRLPTDTPTGLPTGTPTGPPTGTPTGPPTDTPTGVPTGTASATVTSTTAPSPTVTNTAPLTPTDTPLLTPTDTPTGTPAGTATATITVTITPTGTPAGTVSATITATSTSTIPPTATPTATASMPPAATSTQTATFTTTATVTPVPIVATIVIGSATGMPGQTTSFQVTLQTSAQVAGTANDIAFDPKAPIAADASGNPQCTGNAAIGKGDTTFAFEPADCTPGTDCTGIRAEVLSFTNLAPIPTGSVLYTCTVALASDAAGSYPLTCSNADSGDVDTNPLGTDCTNGTITVVIPTATETPTTTPTATPTATPSSTPTAMPTDTAAATPTNTAERTPTNTRRPQTSNDDDSCQIVSGSTSRPAWLLLVPAAWLLSMRRRKR